MSEWRLPAGRQGVGKYAPVTELADVQALEACERNLIEVQLLSGAHKFGKRVPLSGMGKPLGVQLSPPTLFLFQRIFSHWIKIG